MEDMKHLPITSANDDPAMRDQRPVNGLDKLLTTEEVAAWLGIRKCTLEKGRSTRMGDYPRYIRIGRAVRYRRSEVEAWLLRNAFNVDGSRVYPAAV